MRTIPADTVCSSPSIDFLLFSLLFSLPFSLLLFSVVRLAGHTKNVAACCVYSTFFSRLRLCDNNKANKEVAASSSSTRVQLWQTARGNVPLPSCPFLLQLVLSCCLSLPRGTEQRTVNYGLQHLQPPAVAFLDEDGDDDNDDFDSATLASTLSLSPQCNWKSNNNSSGSNHSSSNSCRWCEMCFYVFGLRRTCCNCQRKLSRIRPRFVANSFTETIR